MSLRYGLLLLLVASALSAASAQSPAPIDGKTFDGPAELPREYVNSALKDTPAQGKTWTVNAGDNIERVLSNVSCGDTVQLKAGDTFSGFRIPAKPCDDSRWIIIRSSSHDSSLPAQGTRITPCYAGVASLPGRPDFHCASSKNILARIECDGKSVSAALTFATGANHYRLIGLEVTRAASQAAIHNLVIFAGTADHIVFDRMWFHGTPQDETARGIMLGSSRYIAVVDSFFTDFHCVAKSGSCVEAQAIFGGIGDDPMGPYKIVNNFLEASTQSILFGGARATTVPSDIEVRHNHMFKPLIWMKGQPGFVGGKDGNPFIVKNLFELKNAQRVLVEGNIMENAWGGFSQMGFAILLTPKSQAGSGGTNLCPACMVTDVTIRYNSISHVGAGLQIANGLSDNGGAAHDGQRYSIHDVVIDDIDGTKYSGSSVFSQISVSAGAPLLQNITINHVTAFPAHNLLIVGDMAATSTPMKNFVFTNNIVNAGAYPVWSTGGGPSNCAFHNSAVTTLNACFSNYIFAANAIIALPPGPAGGSWPPHNFFPESAAKVKFVNYNGGIGGDYHLQPSSPFKRKGTDGKDVGADIDEIRSATAGAD